MKELFYLTLKSIKNRKLTFVLSVVSIIISVVLLLGIDKSIKASKTHFINTINSTDIIVASSNGSLDILLNLVFHLSDPLKAMSYKSFEDIKSFDEVSWAVPLSLGDSFKGFDVVSTNADYFKHYRYSSNKSLVFAQGGGFEKFFDVVIGSEVAKKLHIKVGNTIYLSHGKHHHKHTHKNRPFRVAGVLKETMTPNDECVFMQLKADEAIHIEWQSGHFVDMHISNEKLSHMDIKPKHISGMLLGLKNRSSILSVEEKINLYRGENLKAVIPAKALSRLYKLMKNIQYLLNVISFCVFVAAIFTMLVSMFSTLNERRREMAIFRSLGASAKTLFLLFAFEGVFIVGSGIFGGVVLVWIVGVFSPFEFAFGLDIYQYFMLLSMLFIGVVTSLFPALKLYKNSLADGLVVKI